MSGICVLSKAIFVQIALLMLRNNFLLHVLFLASGEVRKLLRTKFSHRCARREEIGDELINVYWGS
jgi:hypothetical protein